MSMPSVLAAEEARGAGHGLRSAGPAPPGINPAGRPGACGDEAAFASLVRRHGALVLGLSRRVLHHDQDAEDVFQATFLLLARKAGSCRWRTSIAGWLYCVAYRLATRTRTRIVRQRARERAA